MKNVRVKTTVRVTKDNSHFATLEEYEIVQRISQDDQQAFTANSSQNVKHAVNQFDNEQKKVTVTLNC